MAHLSEILLSYEVGIDLFIQIVILLLLSFAFLNTLFILKNFVVNSGTELQYSLEKKSYLVLAIIKIVLIIKIILLPFFTYTLDKLSNIIPGAMCAAGVISANVYGEPLMLLKIFLVVLMLLWLTLNAKDLRSYDFKYFKAKLWFFGLIYILAFGEVALEILFFSGLTTINPVLCCSALYGDMQDSNPLPFNLSIIELIVSFYLTYLLIIISTYFKKRYLLLLLSVVFTYISYYSVVYFFSTYVYQLPTHQCPYCLLQDNYFYLGYFIYFSFMVALFYSLSGAIFTFSKNTCKYAAVFYSLFLLFASIHFYIYLIINGTFL